MCVRARARVRACVYVRACVRVWYVCACVRVYVRACVINKYAMGLARNAQVFHQNIRMSSLRFSSRRVRFLYIFNVAPRRLIYTKLCACVMCGGFQLRIV